MQTEIKPTWLRVSIWRQIVCVRVYCHSAYARVGAFSTSASRSPWHRLRIRLDIGFTVALTSASRYHDIGFAFILTSASHSPWHRFRSFLTSASHPFAQIWFMHDRIWFLNMIACTVLDFAANSSCTCAGWVYVQVEFTAKSKTVHAITFVFNMLSRFCCFHWHWLRMFLDIGFASPENCTAII